jgi:nitrate reductase beta subunit
MIKDNEFKNILPKGIKLPKIDAIRDALKVINLKSLRQMLKHIITKAGDNKVFDKGTIDGITVAAIDGTQTRSMSR